MVEFLSVTNMMLTYSINKVFSYVSFLDDFGLLAKADQEYIPFLNYYYLIKNNKVNNSIIFGNSSRHVFCSVMNELGEDSKDKQTERTKEHE